MGPFICPLRPAALRASAQSARVQGLRVHLAFPSETSGRHPLNLPAWVGAGPPGGGRCPAQPPPNGSLGQAAGRNRGGATAPARACVEPRGVVCKWPRPDSASLPALSPNLLSVAPTLRAARVTQSASRGGSSLEFGSRGGGSSGDGSGGSSSSSGGGGAPGLSPGPGSPLRHPARPLFPRRRGEHEAPLPEAGE